MVNPFRKAYSFHRKTVLIVGGSRGLGLVLARELAAEGANVILSARDEEDLEKAKWALRLVGGGGSTTTIGCDATRRPEVVSLVHKVREQVGPIDVLMNVLGMIEVGPIENMGVEDYEKAMQTHFWAPLYCTMEVLSDLIERKGRVVNISSIGGKVSLPHLSPYSASKFALTGFSEGLGAELERYGVTVTTVCPGLMRTSNLDSVRSKINPKYSWFALSDSLPLVSQASQKAASKIIRACRRGRREVILTLPAKCAVTFHAFFPSTTIRALGFLNRYLPGQTKSLSNGKRLVLN
jgi:short-subunit dehydrogenase